MKTKILAFVLLLLVVSCNSESQLKYGLDFNKQRMNMNTPIIPENWDIHIVNSNSATWYNPNLDTYIKSKIPIHASKYVNFQDGILKFEEDVYYGISDVYWDSAEIRESMAITTYYSEINDDLYNIEFKRKVLLTDSNVFLKEITLEEAVQILENWGIDYP